MKVFFFIAFLPIFTLAQTASDSNEVLRKEYFEYKKEGEELYRKATQLTLRIKRYKREIDSLSGTLNFGQLLNERMVLMRYRDTIECNHNVVIQSIVPFDDVMPKENEEIPYDDIELFNNLQLPAKMYNLVLDSLPVQKENEKLKNAILVAWSCNERNRWLLDNFSEIERRYKYLKRRLPELSISFAKTTSRVKSFNLQLEDTLVIWRKDCLVHPEYCKICAKYGLHSGKADEQERNEEDYRYQENELLADPDEPAYFPGGPSALKEFLATNLKYPEHAEKFKLEGRCYIRFKISTEGVVSDVTVVRPMPDCPECDAEAKRLVESMPNWIPGKLGGIPKVTTYNLPISFKLP